MKPLVSILIPAYNSQEWITETLQSAIAQTWERKEIIVVDDGSKDNTLQVARRFESAGVRVVSQQNLGPSATRNNAYAMSQGDYIQWLDADDLLGRDKISRQMEVAELCGNKRLLFSSPWGQFLYRSQHAQFVTTSLWCDLDRAEWLLRKLGENLHMQTSTWLVSRELSDAAGPWDTKQPRDNDGEYFCRVLMASEGVRFVPDAKVFYRATGSSSVSYIGRSNVKKEALWRSMQLHIGHLRSLEDSPRVRKACVAYLQNWYHEFYPDRLDIVERAEQMAIELNGRLEPPRLSWKYSWIQSLFGPQWAKRANLYLPQAKWGMIRWWDKTLFRLESGKRA